ncbi:MAG: PDZ domain-containing protein [Planctomycetaceae bacterium]|nr:PDZ domain-containing protein [Planctomycetaceae bacterium]
MNACWITIFCGLLAFANAEGSPAEATVAQQSLIASLSSQAYADRCRASEQLRKLSTSEVANLARVAAKTASAEAIVRIMAEIDNRYGRAELPVEDQLAASATLEMLAVQDDPLPAESAQQSLNLHSARRAALAMKELRKLGAAIRRGTFQSGIILGGVSSNPPIQIFLDENWKGGLDGIELLTRIVRTESLPQFAARDATVYLIDGHPLTDKELDRLREIVGQNRIANRGRVALGIVGDPVFAPGVIIDRISRNGSADRAGLRAGDMILAIEREPEAEDLPPGPLPGEKPKAPDRRQEGPILGDDKFGRNRHVLADFNDLVEQLKFYRAGDTVRLRVIRQGKAALVFRNFPGQEPNIAEDKLKLEVVSVKLRGWTELGEPAE